jgi:uncharacterized protein YndB with AHSA1/START domain
MTTTELADGFPKLSRFAVMQHLGVLFDAKLVLIRREGRFRYNYLNAIPLAQMYDRWVSRYAQPLARTALDLKHFVENRSPQGEPAMPETPARVVKLENEIRLAAPMQKVFDALTVNMDHWWSLRVRKDSRIVFEPHVGGRMFEDWGNGRGVLYGMNTQWDPPYSFCSAGTTGWSPANFITWHRLEADGADKTILRKSMQFFGEVSDEFVTMMEQGNRAIMEKMLIDYVERGVEREA